MSTLKQSANGYAVPLTDATIEAFLALYGDDDRYEGDSPEQRRRDVRIAADKICLIPDGEEVIVKCSQANPRHEMSLIGFLEETAIRSIRFSSSSWQGACMPRSPC